MSSGFSQQQMINIFERIACVTPPRSFYISEALPEIKFGGKRCVKKMREMVVDCLKLQKLITFQGQLAQLVEEYERIAEVWVFKAEVELALMKPDIALQTVNDALRKKAEPQEMLRDVHLIISSYLNKAKKTNHKPVIIRKPRNDPFSRIYQPDEGKMEEIELLLAYLLGGPAVFDFEGLTTSQPPKDTKKGKQPTTKKPAQNTTQKPAAAPAAPPVAKQPALQPKQQAPVKPPPQIQQSTIDDEPLYQKPAGSAYNILDDLQKKKQQKIQEQFQAPQTIQNDVDQQTGNQLVEFMKKKNLQRSYAQVAQQQKPEEQPQLQKQVQSQEVTQQQEQNIEKQQKEIQNILDMVEVEFKNPAALSGYNILEQQGLVPEAQQKESPEKKTVTFKESLVESAQEEDKPKSVKVGLYQKIREFIMPDVQTNEYEELQVDNDNIVDHVEVMHGDEEDFDGSSESHGFQEEMMQSLNKIRQDGPAQQPANLFDIDDDAAFYIKK